MSLKIAAEHLKSQGRGPDTELIHMTKGEIKGLRQLAQAHGGDLTINPTTGLPEAGFLSSLLPMIAGAAAVALAPETGGMSLEAYSALAAGGIGLTDYAVTGSLKQGLMAGIGAYGGASLASGLAEAGAATAGEAALPAAQTEGTAALADIGAPTTGGTLGAVTTPQEVSQAVANGQMTMEQANAYGQGLTNSFGAAPSNASLMGSGLKAAASAPGTFLANNVGSIGMAAAPALTGAFNQPTLPGATAQTNPMGLKTLPSNFQGQFPTPPSPTYKAQYPDYQKNPYQTPYQNPYAKQMQQPQPAYMADGGLAQGGQPNLDFAGGGAYPMSQQTTPHYATPSQMPTSAQSAMASYEPNTNPLTGELTGLAAGGIAHFDGTDTSLVDDNSANIAGLTKAANAVTRYATLTRPKVMQNTSAPDAGIYKDTNPNTANLDAYSTALYNINKTSKKAGMGSDAVKLAAAKPLTDIEEAASGGIMQSYATGGVPTLGSYSDGGRLLKGPGDGMSDNIPAVIGHKQPARLADGEFVVPADVVSHLGNGSTEAGAKHLYAMMDKIRAARTGRKKQAPQVKAEKYLPK